MDCIYRTNVGAGAAICANFRINYIDVALGNCFNGALINTGTTSGTIFINYICHFDLFLWLNNLVQRL